ncbi:MAG: serine/threonine-protein kinase [Pseudomonadota bacterium]
MSSTRPGKTSSRNDKTVEEKNGQESNLEFGPTDLWAMSDDLSIPPQPLINRDNQDMPATKTLPTGPLRPSIQQIEAEESIPDLRRSSSGSSPIHRRRERPSQDAKALVGQVLGSYYLLSLIGEGGMGRVYEAEHVKLGRKVALKLLRPEYAVKRDAVHRFFIEAKAVNTIGHENIVDITDFVELETGETFFIMELLHGKDLGELQRIAKQPMPLQQAMQIALQVCNALEAAHEKGIIHRDLKPDNIFVLDEPSKAVSVKLLDFGVAKLQTTTETSNSYQTVAGSVIGTPAYMAPEQASGIPADHRSDIYSLGAILYELFTGHPVFKAKSFGEYVVKHMNDIPIPPRNLENAPKIPTALELVILRCLEKDPNRRYQSAAKLREDLARATATIETTVRGILVDPKRSKRRYRLLVPISLAMTLLAAGAFWLASGLSLGDLSPKDTPEVVKLTPRTPPTDPISKTSIEAAPITPNVEPLPSTSRILAKLTLVTQPAGAMVYQEGNPNSLGQTPLVLHLDKTSEKARFSFRLDGFEEAFESVPLNGDAVVSVSLNPPPSVPGPPPSTPKTVRTRKRTEQKKAKSVPPQPGHPKTATAKTSPAKTSPKPPVKINPKDMVDPFAP